MQLLLKSSGPRLLLQLWLKRRRLNEGRYNRNLKLRRGSRKKWRIRWRKYKRNWMLLKLKEFACNRKLQIKLNKRSWRLTYEKLF